MRELWVFWWLIFLPLTVHYNSTGCYRLDGQQISEETIHDFLYVQGIKMSIVNFQATVILDHTAYFECQGTNVQDNEVILDDSSIETFADDGKKILETNFVTKQSYDLFNLTDGESESKIGSYETITRTCKIAGFARNPIFGIHTSLMRLIPVVLVEMHPELYEQAKDHLLDMEYADYFYITSYPVYDGYKIVHDPTITAYCHFLAGESTPEVPSTHVEGLLLLLGIIVVIAVIVGLIVLKRR
jgi:hypothetical protein